MSDDAHLGQIRTAAASHAAERTTLLRQAAERAAELAAAEAQLAGRLAAGDRAGAEAARAAREALRAQLGEAAGERLRLDERLRETLDRLGDLIDPCDADPALPLLLLPVRLETRYTADGAALRVRLYPDDIHIDALERGLTPAEREAGLAFWGAAWRAEEPALDAAWRGLIERVGRFRAAWVAEATRPTNLANRAAEAAPAFPETPPPARAAAVARLLPDRFTVAALQAGTLSRATGHQVAPAVTVGLFAGEGATLKKVNGLRLVEGAEWIADYAEAERVGLAVTLPLQRPGARVDALYAFGLRRSLDPAAATAELEALLAAHRFGRGLGVLPQGAPTNNTETGRTAWRRRPDPPRPALDPPAAAPAAGSNAAVLAAALGLDPSRLAGLEGAALPEQPQARAMATALWWPSWGSFLDKIDTVGPEGATLPARLREQAREFHRDLVRGRGPLPAIRVGDQPYGVLPVSAPDRRWVATPGDGFEAGLLGLLRKARGWWRAGLRKVPRVGGGAPIDEVLKTLLGTSPVSYGLRVRPVLSDEVAALGLQAAGESDADLQLERLLEDVVWLDVIANASRVGRVGSLAGDPRYLSLPLVVEGDAAFIEATLAGGSPAEESVFQALVALAWDHAEKAAERSGAGGRIAEFITRQQALAPALREQMTATAAAATANRAAPTTLHAASAQMQAALALPEPPTLRDFQPAASLARSFGEMAVEARTAEVAERLAGLAVWDWFGAHARRAELRAALEELRATALEERRILLAETLDVASHRLDAWVTALVERRRQALRAAQPAGVTVGAYGWVEDIDPTGQREGDGGYIHAPSMTHAATAGVLRSAWLSHRSEAGGGGGAFAIDLGSARVRRALELVDGMRAGQPLGALLGYRIERAMHEGAADRLVLSLRALAPRLQGRLSDRGEAVAAEAQEAVAAANVLDGVLLVQRVRGQATGWTAEEIRRRLSERPKDNPYLRGDWPAVTDREWAVLAAAVDEAEAALDAVSDLLLAESVHQLVQGNLARASAALDAAGTGDAPPPVPEVVATPAEGLPIAHRILLAVASPPPAVAAGWDASRPRAAAEPALEAWAAARLGDPATVVVATAADGARLTLDAAGRCALDLVHDAGDRAGFDQRLRAALPALPAEIPLAEAPDPAWPPGLRAIGDVHALAASLRALLATARPATPLDLAVPNAPMARVEDPTGLAAAGARAQAACDLLELRAAALEALLAAGPEPVALRAALEGLAAFGVVAPAFGRADVAAGGGGDLTAVAELALAEAARRVKQAEAALAKPLMPASVIEAGQAVFGEGFWILPPLGADPAGGDAWDAALAAPPPGGTPAAARRVLADFATVRDGARRFSEALLLAEAAGVPPVPRVAQLVGAGEVAPASWIGLKLPEGEPTPDTPLASFLLDAVGAPGAATTLSALVLDQWVETLPVRARRGEPVEGTPPSPAIPRVTTGVAFNAAAPSARAPQAILLAVAPDPAQRWTTEALLDTLQETLELAKLRAVTLEHTVGATRLLPALYARSWSLQGEKVLDLSKLVVSALRLDSLAAYVQEPKP